MWLSRVVVEVWGLQCMTADVDCTPSTLIQSGRLNTLPLDSVLCYKCLLLSAGTTAHLWCRIQQQREQGAADRERKKSAASLSAVISQCCYVRRALCACSVAQYTVALCRPRGAVGHDHVCTIFADSAPSNVCEFPIIGDRGISADIC